MSVLGRSARSGGNIYFTGGATALMLDIREQTIDVDIKLDPEPQGCFEAIKGLKEKLDINVELASPDDFVPCPKDWRERSIYIDQVREVKFYHFDLYSQTLAKLERGHSQDLFDVNQYVQKNLIEPATLKKMFDQVQHQLIRYPAINPEDFERKIAEFVLSLESNE